MSKVPFYRLVARELVSLCHDGQFTEDRITQAVTNAGFQREFPGASWTLDPSLVRAVNKAKESLKIPREN